jgi:diguanylate cyclase (GGDEF)-like protein
MLNEAITQARSRASTCYVLMMDLDRFKHVNDVMGHSFGDILLQEVANRLKVELGAGNIQPAVSAAMNLLCFCQKRQRR